jgi:hypothetical protein
MAAEKSLGAIGYPQLSVAESNGDGSATLKLTGYSRGGKRAVKAFVEVNAACAVDQLVGVAQELARKQREHALREWNIYIRMRDKSGYKHPEDK